MDYKIENGEYGNKLTLQSAWDDRFFDLIHQNKVVELFLNSAWGWKPDDLSYLPKLTHLVSFFILDHFIRDVSPVNCLHDLRYLIIDTFCKTEIHFENFPFLERCGIEWRPKAKSIFYCKSLKRLNLNYKGKESYPFSNLTNLEHLHITSSPIMEIEQFSALTQLEFLSLSYCKNLTSLKGIESLKNLKGIEIHSCKGINRLDELRELTNLEYIYIVNIGNIESINFLNKLKKLKLFDLLENCTILDGNLKPLLNFPDLRDVGFRNRKHYNLKEKDIPISKAEWVLPYPPSLL